MKSSITVGVARATGFTSRLIEWLSKGGWSHCIALVLPGGLEVIDARAEKIRCEVDGKSVWIPAGVQIRPISYLKGTECMWLEIPCSSTQAAAAEKAARSVLNRPYDFKGIEDFVTGGVDNSWRTKQSFFCSALGTWVPWKAKMLPHDVLVPFTNIDPAGALKVYWGLGARPAKAPVGLR